MYIFFGRNFGSNIFYFGILGNNYELKIDIFLYWGSNT